MTLYGYTPILKIVDKGIGKEVVKLDVLINLLVSIAASLIANIITKAIDEKPRPQAGKHLRRG